MELTPVEEHAALTEVLTAVADKEQQWRNSVDPRYLAVLDVLIKELPKHTPDVPPKDRAPAFCHGCSFTHWRRCPIVRAVRAAVGER